MITLATLPQATAQQVFDQVATHLLTQGKKAEKTLGVDEFGRTSTCVYHTEDGLRCAAGCLISPEEYHPSMENNPWDDLVHDGVVPKEHMYLIGALQGIHDGQPPKNWKLALAQEAKLQCLNTEVLNVA